MKVFLKEIFFFLYFSVYFQYTRLSLPCKNLQSHPPPTTRQTPTGKHKAKRTNDHCRCLFVIGQTDIRVYKNKNKRKKKGLHFSIPYSRYYKKKCYAYMRTVYPVLQQITWCKTAQKTCEKEKKGKLDIYDHNYNYGKGLGIHYLLFVDLVCYMDPDESVFFNIFFFIISYSHTQPCRRRRRRGLFLFQECHRQAVST